MKTEKEITDLLGLIEREEDFHHIIVKDVNLLEVKTAKDILRWVLNSKKNWSELWHITYSHEIAVCASCGTPLQNLDIKACETGTFYCSDSCATEHVKNSLEK